MRKAAYSAGRVVRRLMFIVAATAMSVAGLALLAGGGYMLLADKGAGETPIGLTEVLAQEATEPAATAVAADRNLDSGAATVIAGIVSDVTPTPTATSLPTATVTPKPPTPAATRISMAAATATPVATPTSGTDELPDTGFGDFLQPIAGFGLAGIALVAHAIRRRR